MVVVAQSGNGQVRAYFLGGGGWAMEWSELAGVEVWYQLTCHWRCVSPSLANYEGSILALRQVGSALRNFREGMFEIISWEGGLAGSYVVLDQTR